MTKKEARDLIYSSLTPVLSEDGFRLKKSQEGFVRPISAGGRQSIGVPFWDYNPRFDFSFTVSIRFNEVEYIANKFEGTPEKYHTMTETAIFQPERFMPGKNAIFKVTSAAEIQNAVNQLAPVFRERVIPFLNEHQDLKSVAAVMKLTEINDNAKALAAVTVAYLTNDPHFQEIVEGYRKRLSLARRFPERGLAKLENLVRYLEKM